VGGDANAVASGYIFVARCLFFGCGVGFVRGGAVLIRTRGGGAGRNLGNELLHAFVQVDFSSSRAATSTVHHYYSEEHLDTYHQGRLERLHIPIVCGRC